MRKFRAVVLVLLATAALAACATASQAPQDRPWPPVRQFP